MVSKRFEQPKQIWKLLRIRITDWDTSQPREDKLEIDVGLNKELFVELSWESHGDGYDRNDQLLMDPGGNYLVVCLSPGFSTAPHPVSDVVKRNRQVAF